MRHAYRHTRGREELGFGDTKLLAATGPLLDVNELALTLLGAALLGLSLALLRSWFRGRPLLRTMSLPFGSFFVTAMWPAWLVAAITPS